MATRNNVAHKFDKHNVILSLTVEIDEGREEILEVKRGDSAEMVSKRFIKEHNLRKEFEAPLAELIIENITRIRQEEGLHTHTHTHIHTPKRERKRPNHVSTKSRPVEYDVSEPEKQASEAPSLEHERLERDEKMVEKRAPKARKFSGRVFAPTLTFLTKTARSKEEKKVKRKLDRLSDKARAFYMRLHMDFIRHGQKLEEEKRHSDELYTEKARGERLILSKKSRTIMRLRGLFAKQFRNYGELLYQEGISQEQHKRALTQQRKVEHEIDELKGVTLRPQISKVAKHIQKKEAVWERLIHPKFNEEHLQELRKEIWQSTFMECTFKPKINSYKEKAEALGLNQGSRFDRLFFDAEARRRRQAEFLQWYPEEFTFRPAICRPHQDDVIHEEYHGKSVFDRLVEYAGKLTERKQKMQEIMLQPIDPATGREYFRPLTGRSPQIERNEGSLPIHEFLYRMKFALDTKKRLLEEQYHKDGKKLANPHYVGLKSQKMLKLSLRRTLGAIFDHLDEDKDGYINLEEIDTEALHEDLVKDIEIIKKTETGKLDVEKFIELMVPLQERNKSSRLAFKKSMTTDPRKTHSFQFKMNPRSRVLAARRRRRHKDKAQWYNTLSEERQRRQTKVEELQKNLESAEMSECTFKPSIHSKRGKSYLKHHGLLRHQGVEKEQEMHGFYFEGS